MRRDLIIGIIVSFLIHAGLWGTSYLPEDTAPVAKIEEPPTIELMEMPELELEPEEEIVETDEPVEQMDFAPPMQTDVPQLVTVDSFVQPIQPPPPENMKPVAGVISIPTARQTGLGKGIEIFDIRNLDQRPMPKFRVQPQYPFEMRRAGVEGEVLVEFIVDSNGDVRNPFVVRSSHRDFEQSAIQAVSKWKFKPGRKGGRDVNTSRVQQLLSFTLQQD
jgi:protein TonB